MLTEDQKIEMCKELDACHSYREQLSQYEQQALLHYAKGKQQFLADRPEDEQVYFRAMNPAYDLADVIAALLATPKAEVAPTVTERPHRANKKQLASLQPPLTVEAVKDILKGLPITITKEGEIAAVLSALVTSGKLVGDASKVHRWCEAATIFPLPDRKTVYNKMQNSEERQFRNPIERSIFSKVLKQAKALE